MNELLQTIKGLAQQYGADTVKHRRHLHQHPELSFQEFQTAQYIGEQLRHLGLNPQPMANTGFVVLIEGNNPHKRTVALRADIDALPIVEASEVSYASKTKGVMHACGHDAHTASLLGTARILQATKAQWEGTVKLIFQPGEEKIPGGASIMIKEGVLENPKPQSILGQHVAPQIPAGKIGFREGMYMASTDELYLTVIGKGGHAAAPDSLIDPVLVAAQIVLALQQVVSRHIPPKIPAVLSIGKVIANGVTNVIPNEVYMEGTFRTMNEEWRAKAHQKIKQIAEGIAQSMGARCEVNILKGFPFLVNEPKLTQRSREAATAYVGKENIIDLDLWMAGEDFAFYTHHADACFYRLGTRNEERGIVSGVHTPTFDIDETALPIGAGLMAWLAIQELSAPV